MAGAFLLETEAICSHKESLMHQQAYNGMFNLLERFALAHTQVTRLNADLQDIVTQDQKFSAKVELKITPRKMPPDQSVSQYQVTARMLCRGSREADESADKPLFTIELVLQAVYRQFQGEPVSFEEFSQSHASLTRQLYPLIHHQLQPIFKQFGLDQVRLPYDLVNQPADPQPQHQIH
jgi:hypothetical protein